MHFNALILIKFVWSFFLHGHLCPSRFTIQNCLKHSIPFLTFSLFLEIFFFQISQMYKMTIPLSQYCPFWSNSEELVANWKRDDIIDPPPYIFIYNSCAWWIVPISFCWLTIRSVETGGKNRHQAPSTQQQTRLRLILQVL